MKKSLFLGLLKLAALFFQAPYGQAQYCGSHTWGVRLGNAGALSGISHTVVMDQRNALEWQIGHTGLFSKPSLQTVSMRNDAGQEYAYQQPQQGHHNSLLLGGLVQFGILQGKRKGHGQTWYASAGLRARIHLDRPSFVFNDQTGHWLTPDLVAGTGLQLGLSNRWEVFADAHAVLHNPDDAVATLSDTHAYVLGFEGGCGLRYRIMGCRRR